jgi:hypothetical protein
MVNSRHTRYCWRTRFQSRKFFIFTRVMPISSSFGGFANSITLADGIRSGRPVTAKGIIDSLIDLVIDSDSRDFGYSTTVWTASLLQAYLSDKHQLRVSRKILPRAIGCYRRRGRHVCLPITGNRYKRILHGVIHILN